MSVVVCKYCEAYVDTDYHAEGFYLVDKETGRQAHEDGNFICGGCEEVHSIPTDD